MSQENVAIARRYHMEIFQKGNLGVADEIISRDFIFHTRGFPSEFRRGPEGVKRLATALRTAFPDVYITHEETISQGDLVVARWTMTGTQKGDLFGLPPSGKSVSVTGLDLYRIWASKIVDLWQGWDQYGMMQQIGAIPSAAPTKR